MKWQGLACDYDGTLASAGLAEPQSTEALRRLKASGRKLLLVTGRELDELLSIYPEADVFSAVIAENGGVLHRPATRKTRLLSAPVPRSLVNLLVERDVKPLKLGHVIIATREPQETVVIECIRELGLELQVAFNKGAVMVLPALVNKATGLKTALEEMGMSPAEVVGIGDAENDQVFLSVCGYSVAVANAISALAKRARWVTPSPNAAGVIELVEKMIGENLS
jgi:hydroxymethylpyrimidine pyrophosphatase-like HAD family hydrolase